MIYLIILRLKLFLKSHIPKFLFILLVFGAFFTWTLAQNERLPTVGGDKDSWGTVLNNFLSKEHNSDGTHKPATLKSISGMVNVKEFGAKGDGVTDDTAAIRTAISVVKSAGDGTVFFPKGDYKINATTNGAIGTAWNFSSTGGDWYSGLLIDSDNVVLMGQGEGSRLRSFASTKGSRANSLIGILGTAGTPIKNVKIFNLGFDCRDEESCVALYAQNTQDIVFANNHVKKFVSTIDVVTFDRVTGGLIQGNHFRDGSIASGLYGANNISIIGNTYYDVREALDADKPVIPGVGGTAGHTISIVGNSYDRSMQDTTLDGAWEIDGFTDVIISGNTIRNARDGVILSAKTIDGMTYATQRAVVKGNTVISAYRNGIDFGGIDVTSSALHIDIAIEGNTVVNSGESGIRIRGTNVIVTGNIVKGSGTVDTTKGYGIEVVNDSSGGVYTALRLQNFTVANNIINGNTQSGIYSFGGINGSVTGNRVYDNSAIQPSIYLLDPNHVTIYGNTTRGGSDGVKIAAGTGLNLGTDNLIGSNITEDNSAMTGQIDIQGDIKTNKDLIFTGTASSIDNLRNGSKGSIRSVANTDLGINYRQGKDLLYYGGGLTPLIGFKVNGDTALFGAGNGLILKSPDGLTCQKVTIPNGGGSLVFTAVTCP